MILLGQDRCNTKGGFRHVALLRSRAQNAGFVRCFGLHGRCSRLVHDEHAKPGMAHAHLLVPKRRPREDVEFTVVHFAGEVRYSCTNFLEKNNANNRYVVKILKRIACACVYAFIGEKPMRLGKSSEKN